MKVIIKMVECKTGEMMVDGVCVPKRSVKSICSCLLFRKFHLEGSVGPTVKKEFEEIQEIQDFLGCR